MIAAAAARLGLRWTCPISRAPGDPDHSPLPDAPADRSRGPLVVTAAEIPGRWRDSPPRAVLVITHRASGLALTSAAGPWHPDATGLRRAKAAVKALLALDGWRWAEADPSPPGLSGAAAAASIRAALGPLAEPGEPAKARKNKSTDPA